MIFSFYTQHGVGALLRDVVGQLTHLAPCSSHKLTQA